LDFYGVTLKIVVVGRTGLIEDVAIGMAQLRIDKTIAEAVLFQH
jgi:hypothetical protein